MSFCSFDKGAGMYGSTPIENMFLLEYLPTAPDGFLRVYLYARMLCLYPELGADMDDMARSLHMDSDAVFNAMSYWERQGLVRRLTDRPPTYAILPVIGGNAPVHIDPMESAYYEYRDFNANLQALFGPDNLLHPKQYEMANDWLNILGFSQDAVLKMVEHRLHRSRSKKPDINKLFAKLNDTAMRWADRGVKSAEDVARALESDGVVDKIASALMKQFSMHRSATVDELKTISRWVNDWGFSQDEIIAACAETTKSRTPTIAYLNSILESRRLGGNELFDGLKAALRELGVNETPTPDQLRVYGEMLDQGFEPETIRLAAAQCARKKKRRFEELEWMIDKWRPLKLFRHEDAQNYVREMNQLTSEVRALLETCGSDRRPQMDDITMYEGWCSAYPKPMIDYAAQCARGMQMPMRYIDKLLGEWAKSGINTLDAARAQHESHVSPRPAAQPAVNPALNYEQRPANETGYTSRIIDLNQYYTEEGEQS